MPSEFTCVVKRTVSLLALKSTLPTESTFIVRRTVSLGDFPLKTVRPADVSFKAEKAPCKSSTNSISFPLISRIISFFCSPAFAALDSGMISSTLRGPLKTINPADFPLAANKAPCKSSKNSISFPLIARITSFFFSPAFSAGDFATTSSTLVFDRYPKAGKAPFVNNSISMFSGSVTFETFPST